MAGATVNLHEAKTSLSKLVERTTASKEIIIAKAGKPKARLVPLADHALRKPGGWEEGLGRRRFRRASAARDSRRRGGHVAADWPLICIGARRIDCRRSPWS
jgi:prevent-host-death family protein